MPADCQGCVPLQMVPLLNEEFYGNLVAKLTQNAIMVEYSHPVKEYLTLLKGELGSCGGGKGRQRMRPFVGRGRLGCRGGGSPLQAVCDVC